ncbi:Rieske 2Fe-2S domain-containing protein, partial [Klebsiella pneumoniae]|uniref:Rieske 2Fe-2S domain-containing protein n=1 Tax=Klebsiella pneumoniae TaxID=573 RepID=UPI003CCB2F8D
MRVRQRNDSQLHHIPYLRTNPRSENWIDAAARDEVPEGDVIGINIVGKEIALYEVAGEIYATDNTCT